MFFNVLALVKVTVVKAEHPLKALLLMLSSVAGMLMETSASQPWNALIPKVCRTELSGMVAVVNAVHSNLGQSVGKLDGL